MLDDFLKGDRLPMEWRKWVVDNLARGCNPSELIRILKDNGFSPAVSTAGQSSYAVQSLSATGPVMRVNAQSMNQSVAGISIPGNKTEFTLEHLLDGARNHLNVEGHEVRLVAHFDSPSVFYFENLLSEAECDLLVGLSEQDGKMARSTVVDNVDGSRQVDDRRISDSTWFQRSENPLVSMIEARIASLIRWPASHGEGLQVLRYQVGGEYRPHVDYFDPRLSGSKQHLQTGGQRVATMIMYLADVEAGGGTRFPRIGLEFRPKKGAGLLFANIKATGEPHDQSLHAGLPVVEGTKYIATKWLRENVYGG